MHTPESQEREAALDGAVPSSPPTTRPLASGLAGPAAERLFTALCDSVRDYAVFLMDADGMTS